MTLSMAIKKKKLEKSEWLDIIKGVWEGLKGHVNLQNANFSGHIVIKYTF